MILTKELHVGRDTSRLKCNLPVYYLHKLKMFSSNLTIVSRHSPRFGVWLLLVTAREIVKYKYINVPLKFKLENQVGYVLITIFRCGG